MLALHEYRAGFLIIQGYPGTGKSHTLCAIFCTFILTGRRVMIGAQSNNGVDGVNEKTKNYAKVEHSAWLETDYFGTVHLRSRYVLTKSLTPSKSQRMTNAPMT